MPSASSEEQQYAQPLLQDYDDASDAGVALSSKPLHVSLRSLEDGADSVFDDVDLRPRLSFWRRIRMAVRRRRSSASRAGGFESVRPSTEEKRSTHGRRFRRRSVAKACVIIPLLVIIFFGLIHIANVFLGFIPIPWDDPTSVALDWGLSGKTDSDVASKLLDITRGVTPTACHSHNDYWRRAPLYDALRWGCTGIEADVWLFDEELLVGHSTNALTKKRTFRSMYVDPLIAMLDHRNEASEFASPTTPKNGVFATTPSQTLVLLVDFKNNGHEIFPVVSRHLTALRSKNYLTYFDGTSTIPGPITVVATGNAPFDLITANTTHRDIFFDAPLERLYIDPSAASPNVPQEVEYSEHASIATRGGQGTVGTSPSSTFDSTNSFYASVNFGASIGWLWFGQIRSSQLDLIRGQIRGAHARGLKARYWGAPKWPLGLRNKVWRVLVEEGVDYLNGDDLKGMVELDWGSRRGG